MGGLIEDTKNVVVDNIVAPIQDIVAPIQNIPIPTPVKDVGDAIGGMFGGGKKKKKKGPFGF